MTITKSQKALLKAVTQRQLSLVREMLDDGVDPDFRDWPKTTPLHAAVKNNDLTMIKILVEAGALVDSRNSDGESALSYASYIGADKEVIRYLNSHRYDSKSVVHKERRSAKGGFAAKATGTPPEPPEIVFDTKTLPEIFKAEKWVGKVTQMQQLWESVPGYLKRQFDFAAAVTKARQETLKKKAPEKRGLKKNSAKKKRP